jgi:hypothetical protein
VALHRTRLFVLAVTAAALVLQVLDAFSGAAGYILTGGKTELNPVVHAIVGFAGVAGLFWAKIGLIAAVTAVIAAVAPRIGIFVAGVFLAAGAVGLHSNAEIFGGQIDFGWWLDLLHAG